MAAPYIALEDLFVAPYVKAHNKGEVVPDDNVKRNGWTKLVAREGTDAAEEVATDAAE